MRKKLGVGRPFAFIDWIRSRIAAKLVLFGLLIATIPLGIVGAYVFISISNTLEENAIATELDSSSAGGDVINEYLGSLGDNIAFLSKSSPVQALISAKTSGDPEAYAQRRAELEKEFQAFSEENPFFTQLRYLDETGQEIVRVDIKLPGEDPVIISQEDLQNKAGRYYFEDTMALNPGEMFISPIDLNREGGQIELLPDGSYRPVIRYGIPVFSENGERQGIVIGNAFADPILAQAKTTEHTATSGERSFIINNDGFYLANSVDSAKEWGGPTDLNTGISFFDEYPKLAEEAVSGQFKAITENTDDIVVVTPLRAGEGEEPFGAFITMAKKSDVLAAVTTFQRVFLGVMGATVLLVAVAAVGVSRPLTRQIDKIQETFSLVGMGDFDARVEVVSRDELGEMAASLNAMLDNTLTLIQSNEERERIQNAIMKLLDEISGVAERDLTVEAEVTADMTGAIADSFNMMIEQLREIISDVQDTTLQVSASANEVQATTEHLAIGSEEQAAQIVETSVAIDEMAASIQQVSEHAALSATVGEQAINNAQQGARAVQETIGGMNRIREQVQETAKRIKRLGESSQEIGEIVQLISDIADRTSILALNASIQAAMAGEAGRGFAVVAEEVERLAERSTEATKQIDALIRTIQNETYEAVAAMETMTNDVVAGSELAHNAGQALEEIEAVSTQLGELIQSISLASRQQARGSETIARSMNEIAEVTQQTAAGAKQAAISINNLSELADDLRSSVSTFKLPGSNGHNGSNGHS